MGLNADFILLKIFNILPKKDPSEQGKSFDIINYTIYMSWFKKISWLGGDPLPSDLPEDTTVADILNMEAGKPFNISNTDEVSVILEPLGEEAKLVAITPYISEPLAELLVSLDMNIMDLEYQAAAMARRATKMVMQNFAQNKKGFRK